MHYYGLVVSTFFITRLSGHDSLQVNVCTQVLGSSRLICTFLIDSSLQVAVHREVLQKILGFVTFHPLLQAVYGQSTYHSFVHRE